MAFNLTIVNDPRIVRTEGCWGWDGYHGDDGYARIHRGLVHKLLFEVFFGPVPEGLELDHLCRNRGCVNPWHLEAVTHAENVRRGLAPEASRAYQLAKTHCPHGDPYDAENTYIQPNGGRACRECGRQRSVARKARLRGVAA